ncbi:M48 family metallopeptidase [Tabrizicola oligotrophica]|uniref:M48 family metalloprotease n=1 Tax=Tabrizicola oligotrophica TaxID=2710650 RepID=A0A6M0QNJ9_9RHOB|nr:M48 family metallopeptidase [Tabrizicola oligotrophica]NEY88786.1 M48 family metalloprotease [Tabrizicola oligotrophica]
MTLKLLPFLLAIGYALLMLRFSVWQTKRTLDANSRPLKGDVLNDLAERMAAALGVTEIRLNIFEIDAVNGLAAPDGRIFLTRGFLAARARGEVTSEELAAVIAHELGHVALGHIRRRMIDFTGQNAVFVVLSAFLNRFLPFIGIWIANVISTALMARLSRRDEFEADAYASALLTKAGIGTGPQKSLFHKLETLTGAQGAEIPVWLRSHPKVPERIAAIEAMETRWNAVR